MGNNLSDSTIKNSSQARVCTGFRHDLGKGSGKGLWQGLGKDSGKCLNRVWARAWAIVQGRVLGIQDIFVCFMGA